MSVKFKDYYEVLGVARDADAKAIQTAYRKLARQWHPDLHKTDKPEAERRIKEINEAHEVLSDPEKRKKYDLLGPNYQEGQDFRPPPGGGGFPFHFGGGGAPGGGGGGFSDFFESLFGGGRAGGARFDFGGGPGGFEHAEIDEPSNDIEAELAVPLELAARGGKSSFGFEGFDRCADCDGSGRKGKKRCSRCGGQGATRKRKEIDVRIPAGVAEGAVISLSGQGKPGPKGQAGDLLLRIRYEPHPVFTVSEGHLDVDVPVAPWEAALGASIEVPTLEGRATVRIPAGAKSGATLRLRGQGMPLRSGGRADLMAKIKVVVPAPASDAERKLYEQLAALPHDDPRAELFRKK